MPRNEAIELQYRIVDLIKRGKEDSSIVDIMFDLSEAWINGEALPIAERMALVACEAAQELKGVPEAFEARTKLPEKYYDIERKYQVYGCRLSELATKDGPCEGTVPTFPTPQI